VRARKERHHPPFEIGAALLATALAAIAWPAPALPEEPAERVSEELQTAGEAWEEPGFRIQLRIGTEDLAGAGATPSGSGLSLSAEPGFRLSRWWSIGADLTYTIVGGQVDGLRWSGIAGLGFHPAGGLFVSAGAGYGGLMVESFDGLGSASCTGTGPAVGAKAGWLFPVGTLFATGPLVGTQVQWVRCPRPDHFEFALDDVEAPSDAPAGPTTWRHTSLHFGWSLAWR